MAEPQSALRSIVALLDRILPDAEIRDRARLALIELDRTGELQALLGDPAGTDPGQDRWSARARPTFLYVMYALLLWAIPMGLIAAIRPQAAEAIAHGMAAYLAAIPEPLYALFGTGYLGYTVAREWGKAKGK